VTSARVDVGGGFDPSAAAHALLLNRGDPVHIGAVRLTVLMQYRIVRAENGQDPWKVTTAAYFYTVEDRDGREILAYHWHPATTPVHPRPHLHLGPASGAPRLRKAHLPTGRVAVEDVVRLLVRDFGVHPRLPAWRRVLDETQAAFEKWRSWR